MTRTNTRLAICCISIDHSFQPVMQKQRHNNPCPRTQTLTDGAENDRPPILPPDLAANASPGAAKVTAAIDAATANFFARSVLNASQGPPPPSPDAMRSGEEAAGRCARVRAAVVPEKLAWGAGMKPCAGAKAAAVVMRDDTARMILLVAGAVDLLDWE